MGHEDLDISCCLRDLDVIQKRLLNLGAVVAEAVHFRVDISK